MKKSTLASDKDVENMLGESFLISWGANEVQYAFGVPSLAEAQAMALMWQHKTKPKYKPFSCTHDMCPNPLGYIYDIQTMSFTIADKGESAEINTIAACIFIPSKNRVQFDKFRLETQLKIVDGQARVESFVATAH